MEVTIFIYNLFLIILYSVVLTLSGFYYLKTKNNCYFAISILFSLYLFDNVVIYMTEFIKTFSISYNKLFIAVPTYKTLIIISILAVYIALNTMFFNLKNSKIWYFALGLLTIFLFIIPVMQRTAFKSWLFFVPGDLFFVLFNSYLLIVSKNNKVIERKGIFIHVNKLLTYTLFMSCLVFVEDSFVIFNIDVYSDTILNITNRNFSEDILRISQSLILIPYLLNLFFAESRQKEAADTAVSDNDNDSALKDKTDENEHEYYKHAHKCF